MRASKKKLSIICSIVLTLCTVGTTKVFAQQWQQGYFFTKIGAPSTTKNFPFYFDNGKASMGVTSLSSNWDSNPKVNYTISYINEWAPDTKVDTCKNISANYSKSYDVISNHGYYFVIDPSPFYDGISGYVFGGN